MLLAEKPRKTKAVKLREQPFLQIAISGRVWEEGCVQRSRKIKITARSALATKILYLGASLGGFYGDIDYFTKP